MPFVPVANAIQANIRGTYLGEQVENTLYFGVGTPPTAAGLLAAGNALAMWWQTSVMPNLSIHYTFREVYLVSLVSASAPTATAVQGAGTAGGTVGDGMPGNVALCVSFRTEARGRSFRGRNYVPAVPESDVAGNTISSGFIDPIVAAYSELLVPGDVVTGTWGVVSRFANGVERTTGILTSITAVLVVDNTVDSQRRRLPGRGR
jgi:hypothetical protein